MDKNIDKFWEDVDGTIALHNKYILSDKERAMIAEKEQKAYEANIPSITEILTYFKEKLTEKGFWTELQVNKQGLRFRYSKAGYYGPAGFASQQHIAGPLVLAELNPKGEALAFFWKNDLDQNIEIGTGFILDNFIEFIKSNILSYLNNENLILSGEDYERLRNF